MQGTIGLLLYVAVMILGSILKKMAEDKTKQARIPIGNEDDVYTVAFDDTLQVESPLEEDSSQERMEASSAGAGFGFTIPESTGEFQGPGSGGFEDWDDDEDSGWRKSAEDSESHLDNEMRPRESDWVQAIVLSEIIREPRARRAWPNR